MSEGIEAVKEVKKFIEKSKTCPTCGRSPAALIITDVPIATLKLFKDLANSEEFRCDDRKGGHYGFLLKELVDSYVGKIPTGLEEMETKIELLSEQIMENPPGEQVKPIRLLNGKELNLGG